MRISATGLSDRSGRLGAVPGFTLVELLVVIAIVSLLSGLVALSTAPDPRRAAAADAARLALLLEAALQEAQWGRRAIAWSPDANGYRFWQTLGELQWQPITEDELFRPRKLAEGMNVGMIEIEGQPLPAGSLLVLRPGTPPLFRIAINAPQGTLVLRSLPSGRVELQAQEPR